MLRRPTKFEKALVQRGSLELVFDIDGFQTDPPQRNRGAGCGTASHILLPMMVEEEGLRPQQEEDYMPDRTLE